jgi:glycosyltransferase involved in cell wall biosynthesis
MARIVTVYASARDPWRPEEMGHIRWVKISEALARAGHCVDIATNEPGWRMNPEPVTMGPLLRRVPLAGVDWRKYDVVKTLFHHGFNTLEAYGGARHPFLICKLGSVVGARDMDGIYFYGKIREGLFATQKKIHRAARYVTVLSRPAEELMRREHGEHAGYLLVPGGVDDVIPAPGDNPYDGPVCLFSGNIYTEESQPEANRVLVDKLNTLGRLLTGSGVRLCFQGPGDTGRLDAGVVTVLGVSEYQSSWNYMQHAAVGLVVSAGPFMHNNESTKIYHYLRAGLPVVSESGFPNDHVVRESGLGHVVPEGKIKELAGMVISAARAHWDREGAVRYVRANHTWDVRAKVYEGVIPERPRMPLRYRMFGK